MKTGNMIPSALMLVAASTANADSAAQFEVSITNISKGVAFTPFIAATHTNALSFFELGAPASVEIAQIAEGGNIAPLQEVMASSSAVYGSTSSAGLLMPGETVTLAVDAPRYALWWSKLSLAAMLLPTNDTFVSLNGVRLPTKGSVTYLANAYDAGRRVGPGLKVIYNVQAGPMFQWWLDLAAP